MHERGRQWQHGKPHGVVVRTANRRSAVSGQHAALLLTGRVRYSEACAGAAVTVKVVTIAWFVASIFDWRAHRVRPLVAGAVRAMHSTRLSATSVIIFCASVLTA